MQDMISKMEKNLNIKKKTRLIDENMGIDNTKEL